MKQIVGYVKEITYGVVRIEVPDKATDAQIRKKLLRQVENGNVQWTNSELANLTFEEDK